MTATVALLAASALHAGFQLVVSVVVYPALAEVPSDRWPAAHDAHSRRITWLVAPLYAVVAATCLWVLVAGPHTVATGLALGGHAAAAGTTAAVAGPTHGRLAREGRQLPLVRRLLVSDRVRTAGALVALVASLVAVASR